MALPRIIRTYRVFTNDRGQRRGADGKLYPMYSALQTVNADSGAHAIAKVDRFFGVDGGHAPIVAIVWPPASAADKAWLAKHT